jgi:hypothetical protein
LKLQQRIRTSLAELGASLPLAAVALLLINDRVLKATFHNAITGKLSDVAICFLLPLLVSAALGMIVASTVARRLWVGAVVTAAIFTALEMSDLAGAVFRRAMAPFHAGAPIVLTRDPTDLLALACVPLAIAYGRWRATRPRPMQRRWASSAAGAIALVAGALALMADSPAGRCDHWSAPVAFQVAGDCGASGLIVVEADSYSGQLTITNSPALLTPPAASTYSTDRRYTGTSCPYTLEKGEWEVTLGSCPTGGGPTPIEDAGASVDAGDGTPRVDGGAPVGGCPPTYRRCRAALQGDGLWFICVGADPNVPLCRSQLTVLP